MAFNTQACRACGHKHPSPPAGMDPDAYCVHPPDGKGHNCDSWQCPPNIARAVPHLNGFVDCQVSGDPECYNDGLCCHDSSSWFECPWERGEYASWCDWVDPDYSNPYKEMAGDTSKEMVVSAYKRSRREACTAHECFDEDRMAGYEAKGEVKAACTHPVHAAYDKHRRDPNHGPMSEALWAMCHLHRPECVNWDGDTREVMADLY